MSRRAHRVNRMTSWAVNITPQIRYKPTEPRCCLYDRSCFATSPKSLPTASTWKIRIHTTLLLYFTVIVLPGACFFTVSCHNCAASDLGFPSWCNALRPNRCRINGISERLRQRGDCTHSHACTCQQFQAKIWAPWNATAVQKFVLC